jgi:hypothetical protein
VATLLAIEITELNGGQCLIDVPQGTTKEQIEAVALSYLRTHPEELNDDLTGLFSRAFAGAYPCRD